MAAEFELLDLGLRFGVNAVAMVILIFGFYYRRHGDRILATTAALFNIFAFAVLGKLSSVEFSLAAGFGLFAILALFSLRSEQLGRIEIAYFFGAIAIAVICSIGGSSLLNNVAILTIVLVGVWIVDHPALLSGSRAMTVTLDNISPELLGNPEAMRHTLSARLGVHVTGFDTISMSYVNDLAVISLTYRKA
jgi:CDP-diglyceride synthetase